jgi:hypothetical protein
MQIIECTTVPSFTSEDGIFVILPTKISKHFVSIYGVQNGRWKWRYSGALRTRVGDDFVQKEDQTLYLLSTKENFISCLSKIYPEDFEFFLWHDEVWRGEYHRGEE